jgi:hypothetical protein
MPAMPTSFASRSTGPPAADDLRRRNIRTCRRQHGSAAPRRSLPRCIQASLATLAVPSSSFSTSRSVSGFGEGLPGRIAVFGGVLVSASEGGSGDDVGRSPCRTLALPQGCSDGDEADQEGVDGAAFEEADENVGAGDEDAHEDHH